MNNKLEKNYLICIEGPDNIGKTTFTKDLLKQCNNLYTNISYIHFKGPTEKKINKIYQEQKDSIFFHTKLLLLNDKSKNKSIIICDRSMFGELVYSKFRNYTVDYLKELKVDLLKLKNTIILFIVLYADQNTYEQFKLKNKKDTSFKYAFPKYAAYVSTLFINVSKWLNKINCVHSLVINSSNFNSLDKRNDYLTTKILSTLKNFNNFSSQNIVIPFNLNNQIKSQNCFSQNKINCPEYKTCKLGNEHDKYSLFGQKHHRPTSAYGVIKPKYIFIGKAPKYHNDKSNNLFQEMLQKNKISQFDIWVTNIILCIPKDDKLKNYLQLKNRLKLWCVSKRLKDEITCTMLISPKAKIITMGTIAYDTISYIKDKNWEIIKTYSPSYFLQIGKSNEYINYMKNKLRNLQ